MKRYRFYRDNHITMPHYCAVCEDPIGEFVKYEDYKELYDTAVGLKLALKLLMDALKDNK